MSHIIILFYSIFILFLLCPSFLKNLRLQCLRFDTNVSHWFPAIFPKRLFSNSISSYFLNRFRHLYFLRLHHFLLYFITQNEFFFSVFGLFCVYCLFVSAFLEAWSGHRRSSQTKCLICMAKSFRFSQRNHRNSTAGNY